MVETISIRDQIKKLIELQKIDAEIFDYKRQLREKPQYIEQLKSGFEAKKAKLKAHEDQYKHLQVEHKTMEMDLQSKDDLIGKSNAQLSQLKTNKEYTAKISEIESIKADKSIIEEKLILSFDALDAAKAQVEKEKAVLAEEEKKFSAEKKAVDDSIKVLDDQIKVLEGQRTQLLPSMNKNTLSRYERILNHTDGSAIVSIRQGSCSGCYMKITEQVLNQIRMYKELVFCETCARILYLEDEL